MKRKFDKLDFMKTKNFCSAKDCPKKKKKKKKRKDWEERKKESKESTDWEKMFVNHISNKD